MNGPHRLWIWLCAAIGASLPLIVLDFFLPDALLKSTAVASSWIDIPDKLVPEFGFIGVALFISCAPEWLSDGHFRTFKSSRRRWLLIFRLAAILCAGLSLFHYIRISLIVNKVFDPRFTFDMASNKLALFWCVIAVVFATFAAVALHLGRAGDQQ